MANLTITVDDELLKKARMRALELGSSVNAILAEYLRSFANDRQAQDRAIASLFTVAAESREASKKQSKARKGRSWTRDDLHERR